ncbi:MAG: hypothetical protein A2511_15045 [Deltaproteobacteria bacterium RIFOXYD12_FULL_50_9]|nr:MAG: hypothetical protein A2511_15045 [Deltaproteobacteria bacterium RIFOXYD12_FULL_50_9]
MKQLLSPWKSSERFTTTIFLYVFLALFLIFGALTCVFISIQKDNFKKEVLNTGTMLSQMLAQNVRLGVFSENQTQLYNAATALFNSPPVIEVSIYNPDGKILLQKFRDKSNTINVLLADSSSPSRSEIIKQIDKTITPLVVSKKDYDEFWMPVWSSETAQIDESLYFDHVVEPASKHILIGAVAVIIDQHPMQMMVYNLITRIASIAMLFFLIAGGATYLIVKTATKPLNSLLSQVSEHLGPTGKAADLGMLSTTFDNMIKNLTESFATIKELNTNLEMKIDARTKDLALHSRYLEKTNRQLEETLQELKNTQSQLIQSEKMAALGQLIAGVAHEINNTTNFITGALPPLNKVINQIKTLLLNQHPETVSNQNEIGASPETLLINLDTLLANISEGARRTSKIVKDLKNFSRPGEEDNLINTDLVANLESTLTVLYNEYKYDVEIIKDFQPNLPLVTCYPNQLNQVFLNIILNAIQAVQSKTGGKSKGTIQIIIRQQNSMISIRFIDNGCGVPRALKHKIFDPFFTTKAFGKGTGLGLSISYGIIKKHQGQINLQSKEGEGAEFEVLIPITQKMDRESDKPRTINPADQSA